MNKSKIKKNSAIISMLVLGILAIIYAIQDFIIDLTGSTYGFVGLGIFIILITEIGIKRITKISRLKQLSNQQYLSLFVAVVVLSTSIGLFFEYQIPVLSNISGGSFLTGGIFIILEALTWDN